MSKSEVGKKIIVVGGGFAGLYTVKNLQKNLDCCKNNVTLINKNNYFYFSPMIHEVATGGIDQSNVVYPLRELISDNTSFECDEITEIDLDKQLIASKKGQYTYDYLVLATGSKVNYFGKEYLKNATLTLNTLEDAIKIKHTVLDAFEAYTEENIDPLDFVIVGGGPTGVELAAELSEFIYETLLPDFPKIRKDKVSIKLLSGKSVLATFDKTQQVQAREYLAELKVEVIDEFVNDYSQGVVTLADGTTIESNYVIWVPGVIPNHPHIVQDIEKNKYGSIVVENTLQLPGYENVLVLGDLAAGWPNLAYTATRQASIAAKNIACLISGKPLKEFNFEAQVKLVSLGQKTALADLFGIKLRGRVIWFLWRTVYLAKIISWRNKVKIATDWTFNLFSPRDSSKI